MSQTLKLGIKQKRKKPSLQKLHQDITSWKSRIHTTTSDRSKATPTRTQIITARVSTIISAAVEVVSGSPQVGECYVAVFLEDEDQVIKGLVCRGYIYDLNPVSGNGAMPAKEGDRLRIESQCSIADVTLRVRGTQLRNQVIPGGWTGTDKSSTEGPGARKLIVGADPAVGVDTPTDTVPDNARWRIVNYRWNLLTGPTAGDREAGLQWTTGGSGAVVQVSRSPVVQAASLTHSYNFSVNNTGLGVIGTSSIQIPCYLPPTLILEAGETLVRGVVNFKADDNHAASNITVEEWLVP